MTIISEKAFLFLLVIFSGEVNVMVKVKRKRTLPPRPPPSKSSWSLASAQSLVVIIRKHTFLECVTGNRIMEWNQTTATPNQKGAEMVKDTVIRCWWYDVVKACLVGNLFYWKKIGGTLGIKKKCFFLRTSSFSHCSFLGNLLLKWDGGPI